MSGKNVFLIVVIQAATERLCAPQTRRPTHPPHLQEYFEQLKHREPLYDPTHGYEPYWADGDWLFMELKPEPNATTTRKPTLVCGDDCPYIYRKVKHVCAHSTNNLIYSGCHRNCWGNYVHGLGFLDTIGGGCKRNCFGNWIDDLTRGFHTFETYCDFLNAQCRSPVYDKWIFVHSGKCITKVSSYMKLLHEGKQVVSRVTHYFTQLSEARANHSLPPIHFT